MIACMLYTKLWIGHWTIEYYETSRGKCPVREFVDSLSPESKAKYIFIADLLEEYGIGVKEPYVKPLAGTKKLFEIRIKDISRIFTESYTLRLQAGGLSYCMALQKRRKRLP